MTNKLKKLLSLLLIGSIGGLLAAFGGAENTTKGWRRLGIPLLITLSALYILRNWWLVSIMSMAGVLSMGYGMPDILDGGSTLGSFWGRVFPYHVLLKTPKDLKLRLLANIFTRATIGIAICCSMLSVPILRGNWGIFSLCSIGIIASYAALSWCNLGTFKAFKKELSYSEFIPFSIIVILAQVIIKL